MTAPIRKIALGLTVASGAVLTAWLLTGDRKHRTKAYLVRGSESIRRVLKTDKQKPAEYDDSEVHYI